MKPLLKFLWGLVLAASVVRCAPAQIVTTDTYVEFAQRGPGGTVETRGARGDQNLWKVWGFDTNGHLAPLSISELITGSGYTFTPADGSIATAKLADAAVTEAKIGSGAVTSAKISDGTIGNADVAANAGIALTKLEQRVGTAWAGTTQSPITTNPYSPTWTTETLAVVYGANGTFNLPPISTYDGAALVVITPGSFTVTINPNGSEVIWKDGSALSGGADDTITGSAGLMTTYLARGGQWVRVAGGGNAGFPNPATEDLNLGGYNIENGGVIKAASVQANLAGSTGVPGSQIVGPLGDLVYGKITTTKGFVFQPNLVAPSTEENITIATWAVENEITLNEATETVVFDAQPEAGKEFMVRVIVDLPAPATICEVNWPSTYSYVTGGLRTLIKFPNNKPQLITVRYDGTSYKMSGDPQEIIELQEDTTPAITASVPIDQGNGTERASLSSIRDAFGTTYSGTAAVPNTDATVTISFTTESWYHHSGATQELELPPSAGYVGRWVGVRFGFSGTVSINPNGSESIDLDSTATSAGEAVIITGTPGKMAVLGCDTSGWFVSGGNASFAEATP